MALMAENISLHISGFNLLRDVSMRVEPGTVTAIVGPNGAGKSSLLKVLTGEMKRHWAGQSQSSASNIPGRWGKRLRCLRYCLSIRC